MLALSLTAQCVWVAGAILWSVSRVNRTECSKRAVIHAALLLYGLLVAGCLLFSVAVPAGFIAAGADEHAVIASFPEPICNVPVVLFGWGFALIVIGLTGTVPRHPLVARLWPRQGGKVRKSGQTGC